MHPVIYLNKTMVEATKARVAPVSSAMLYGRGVFTTLAIYNSQPFLWSKHWQRLTHTPKTRYRSHRLHRERASAKRCEN